MKRMDEFRIYYNHSIHPELMRLEKKRKRLILLLTLSVILIIGVLALEFYLNIFLLSLFLILPIGFYIFYLIWRFREFSSTFKPLIINLILDFIDNSINFGTMKYEEQKFISKEVFVKSQIFVTDAPFYKGEDMIYGKIGDVQFEMCELEVKQYSKIQNRLDDVFKGIFLKAKFNRNMHGSVLILPKHRTPLLSRSIKSFNKNGGDLVHSSFTETSFEDTFTTFATANAPVQNLLSSEMQAVILKHQGRTKQNFYISFIEGDFYLALTEDRDMLEPFLFQSNLSFELVKSFFEDISLLLAIVEDFDIYN